MTLFNTIARTIIVLFAIGLIFISVSVEKYMSEPSFEAAENPVERLFGITRAEEFIQEDEEIFMRQSFAYLAGDNQTADNGGQIVRPINDTFNRLVVAKNLARQRNFDKALDILSNVESGDALSYDVRLLQAQINSAAGNYHRAEQIFRNLRAEFPHQPDLMVAYAHLYLDRGQLADAETLFSKTLFEYPGFSAAQAGLTKVRQARQQ